MKKGVMRVCVLLTAAAAVLIIAGRILSVGVTQPEETRYALPAAANEGKYIVKAYNGKVSLFTDEFQKTPAVETDIAVEGLRAFDRQMLENGIKLATYEEVLSLFEDLGA